MSCEPRYGIATVTIPQGESASVCLNIRPPYGYAEPGTGEIRLAGLLASVTNGNLYATAQGRFALSSEPVGLDFSVRVKPVATQITMNGQAASFALGINSHAGVGQFRASGQQPPLKGFAAKPIVGMGDFVLEGQRPNVTDGVSLVGLGIMAFNGSALPLVNGNVFTAKIGKIKMAGGAPRVIVRVIAQAGMATMPIVGQAPTVVMSTMPQAGQATTQFIGQQVTTSNFAQSGVLSMVGQQLAVVNGVKSLPNYSPISINGQPAKIVAGGNPNTTRGILYCSGSAPTVDIPDMLLGVGPGTLYLFGTINRVDWGDGQVDVNQTNPSHTYTAPTTAIVSLAGNSLSSIRGDAIISVGSWGGVTFNSSFSFYGGRGSTGITSVPNVAPPGVTNMSNMFRDAADFNSDISGWDTAAVTDMTSMFYNAEAFDQDISSWCVENIPSKPSNFDTGAPVTWITAEKPNWGAPCTP